MKVFRKNHCAEYIYCDSRGRGPTTKSCFYCASLTQECTPHKLARQQSMNVHSHGDVLALALARRVLLSASQHFHTTLILHSARTNDANGFNYRLLAVYIYVRAGQIFLERFHLIV
jgi:hypothetical protein